MGPEITWYNLRRDEIEFGSEHIIDDQLADNYQEYFEYVRNNLVSCHILKVTEKHSRCLGQ